MTRWDKATKESQPSNAARPVASESASRCNQCGVQVLEGMHNCPQCGTRLRPTVGATPESKRASALMNGVAPRGAVATVRPPTSESSIDQSQIPGRSDVLMPRLVMLAQDGTTQRVIPLSEERMDIGRTEGEIILPDDMFLADRHARFVGRDGARAIHDLGSLNGIYLRIRGSASLRDGDFFLVGLQLLKFDVDSSDSGILAPVRIAGCSLFGSSTSPRYARLSERSSDGVPRSVFVIGRDETILGREVGDIVFSGDPFMSRRHAALNRDPTDGTFTLRDLGSSNGTFIRVRGKVELESGDHLRIGQHLFRFEMDNP